MKHWVVLPAPKGQMVRCIVIRNKTGLVNRYFPLYHVYLSVIFPFCFSSIKRQEENGELGNYLMSAKKRQGNRLSYYLMSASKTSWKRSSGSYLGKIKSNLMEDQFRVFDAGLHSKGTGDLSNLPKEIAALNYEENKMSPNGPRIMNAVIPEVDSDGNPIEDHSFSVKVQEKPPPIVRFLQHDKRDMQKERKNKGLLSWQNQKSQKESEFFEMPHQNGMKKRETSLLILVEESKDLRRRTSSSLRKTMVLATLI